MTRPPPEPRAATIEINGPALRHIRLLTGVGVVELSQSLGYSRAYLTKIELGHNKRVSAKAYAAICDSLGIRDRRVLMAAPHTPALGAAS